MKRDDQLNRVRKSKSKRNRRRLSKLKVAALSVGLATAWGGADAAVADSLVITNSSAVELTNATVYFGVGTSYVFGMPYAFLFGLGTIAPGETVMRDIPSSFLARNNWVPYYPNEPTELDFGVGFGPRGNATIYSFVATTADSSSVVVASTQQLDGRSYSSIFENWVNTEYNISKSAAITALQAVPDNLTESFTNGNGDYNTVINFAGRSEIQVHIDDNATLYSFTDATPIGSVTVRAELSSIPEPGGFVLLASLTGIVVGSRRRKRIETT